MAGRGDGNPRNNLTFEGRRIDQDRSWPTGDQTARTSHDSAQAAKTAHLAQGRGSLPESTDRRALDGRSSHQKDAVDADTETLRRAVPISIPDPPYVCQHDAVRRRASNVGGQADGPQGLENDCPRLRPLDA